MRRRLRRLSRLVSARPLRGATALVLALTVASTGVVALASPALADTAPTLTQTPSQSPDRDPTPRWDFLEDPAATYECAFAKTSAPPVFSPCTSPFRPAALATDGSDDGDYAFAVRAVGSSAAATDVYTLDTVGSVTVVAPPSPGNDVRPTWTLQPEPGATTTCRLDGGSASTCTGSFAPAADLTAGSHTLTVDVVDSLGNSGTVTSIIQVDLTGPPRPVVTGSSGQGSVAAVRWTWSMAAGSTARCTLMGPSGAAPAAACDSAPFTQTLTAAGSYSLSVVVTDSAGNASPAGTSPTYTYQPAPPPPPVFSWAPPATGSDRSPTWTFSTPAVSTTCQLSGPSPTPAEAGCDSGTYTPPAPLADGSWTLTVTSHSATGATSSVTSALYALAAVGPDQPSVSGPAGTGNDRTPAWTFGLGSGQTAECQLVQDGAPLAFAPCSSGVPVSLPGEGTFTYQVALLDAAGDRSPVGSSVPYTYDATAPDAPRVTAPTSPSRSTRPVFPFTSDPTATTSCRVLRSGVLVLDWTGCTSPVTIDLSGSPDGTYTLQVRPTDAAGNTGPSGSSPGYVLDTLAPSPPTVTGPAGPSSNPRPSFTIATSEPGLGANCQLVRDGIAQGSPQPCASPYTPTLSSSGDWVLVVQLTDDAGNASPTGSSGGYVFDTTPPTRPVVHAPPSPGRDRQPSWAVSVQAGSTSQCRVTSGTGAVVTVVSAWAPCALPATTDLSGQPDGTYTLAVRSTNAVGLVSAVGTADYQLDTTAPNAPVFTTQTAATGHLRAVSFSFTTDAGTTVSCHLTSGAAVVSPDTSCSSPEAVSLSGLPDGAYTLSAQATDAAGNISAAQTATYVLDTVPPAAPVLVTGPARTSPDRTPTWTFTAEPRATVTCRLTGAASGVVIPDTPCATSFAADLTSQADDTYTFTAVATDAAGNVGTSALTGSYLLDSAAPVTADVVAPRSPGRNNTPTWQVSASEGQVQCRLLKGATVVRDWADCGPTYTVPLGVDGIYTFGARVVDDAGNVSAVVTSRYRLDTTPPAPAVLTSPASPSSDRAPTWTVAAADTTVTARCEVLGPLGAVVTPFGTCPVSVAGSPYTLNLSDTTATDGDYTLVVRLTDSAGNASSDASGSYTLDTTASNAVLVLGPTSPASSKTPVWQLTGDSDAALECRLSSAAGAGAFAPCLGTRGVPGSGSFTADLSAKPDGTYTLTVRSRDLAGNLGPETTSTYVLDTVPPPTPAPPVAPPSPSQRRVVTWTFSVEQGASAYCTLSSASAEVAGEQLCSSPWTTDLAGAGDGDYALTLHAVDAAGNVSGSSSAHYVLDTTPPQPPVITNTPGSPNPDPTPTWTVQPSDSKDRLECRLAGSPTSVWSPCGDSVTFDLSPALSGTFQLQVRETDNAGNVSDTTVSEDYDFDLTAPAPPEVYAPAAQRSNSLHPVFRVVRPQGDLDTRSLVCAVTRFDGGTSTASPCEFGSNTVDLTGLTGDGKVELAVRSRDALGNLSGAGKATYHYDDIPPATPSLLGPAPSTGIERTVEFTFGGVADADHYVCSLRRAGQVDVVALTSCASPDKVTLPSTGTYTFSVWSVDSAGNRSLASQSASYTALQQVPRPAAAKGPAAGSDATPTWTITAPVGYAIGCLLGLPGGQALTYDCTSPVTAVRSATTPLLLDGQSSAHARLAAPAAMRGSSFTANLEGRPAGSYSLALRLTDASGHVGDYSPAATYRYLPTAAPTHLGPGLKPATITPQDGGPAGAPVPTARTTGSVPAPAQGTAPPAAPSGPSALPALPALPVLPHSSASGSTDAGHQAVNALPHVQALLPAISAVPRAIGNTLADSLKKPTIPLLLLVIVIGFLLLQNQIDRRDPKLAAAPVGAEPELDFAPTVRRAAAARTPPGPARPGGAPS